MGLVACGGCMYVYACVRLGRLLYRYMLVIVRAVTAKVDSLVAFVACIVLDESYTWM
jgi:hypothetical protein